MIEGLKVTVDGKELRELAFQRALHHEQRAETYRQQAANLQAAQVDGNQNTSGGNPVEQLNQRRVQHENDGRELRFVATHIDVTETYLLDRPALERLGIVSSRY